jgi:hypothetical protein
MFSKVLKWFLILVGVIVAISVLFFVYMRFHDGPIEIISGGPFQAGELIEGPEPDWSFLVDRATVEFQLMKPASSRLLWLAVVDNRLYIISGYMRTGIGKIWKQWPRYAEQDDRALLRVDGKIYKRTLVRLTADEFDDNIGSEFSRKYGADLKKEDVASGSTWLFEMAPRQ